jgi:hypothetical protein
MFTVIIELIAIVLLLGSIWHASHAEGRSFAQQWFTAGYLTALTREILNQVMFRVYVFAPAMLRVGSAPVLVTLLTASIAYLAYAFAKRFMDPSRALPMAVFVFVIAASIALPIEATAAQFRWWLYTIPTMTWFGGMPITAPLMWGANAVILYAFFWRIHQTRLAEPGKLYALIALSPIMAAAQMILTILLSA